MTHTPNKLDIKTDLIRCVMASFSPKKFDDANVKIFLAHAEKNLEELKHFIGISKYRQAKARLNKAKDSNNSIKKRREDLLTASYFLG